ncbi:MAG: hypothetical protein NQ127_02160 [Candidatus Cardinium sp.]|nr:hypothetical protein [Candidatus Cardinium sp.]
MMNSQGYFNKKAITVCLFSHLLLYGDSCSHSSTKNSNRFVQNALLRKVAGEVLPVSKESPLFSPPSIPSSKPFPSGINKSAGGDSVCPASPAANIFSYYNIPVGPAPVSARNNVLLEKKKELLVKEIKENNNNGIAEGDLRPPLSQSSSFVPLENLDDGVRARVLRERNSCLNAGHLGGKGNQRDTMPEKINNPSVSALLREKKKDSEKITKNGKIQSEEPENFVSILKNGLKDRRQYLTDSESNSESDNDDAGGYSSGEKENGYSLIVSAELPLDPNPSKEKLESFSHKASDGLTNISSITEATERGLNNGNQGQNGVISSKTASPNKVAGVAQVNNVPSSSDNRPRLPLTRSSSTLLSSTSNSAPPINDALNGKEEKDLLNEIRKRKTLKKTNRLKENENREMEFVKESQPSKGNEILSAISRIVPYFPNITEDTENKDENNESDHGWDDEG